jgi:hypothetical protein
VPPRKRTIRATPPPPEPVVVRTAHPLAWATARNMAGDTRRLTVDPDGWVVIHNTPQRQQGTS